MEITSNLVHIDDQKAVCEITVQDQNNRVTIYATALAAESPYYPDLAQSRALQLALKTLQKGSQAILENMTSRPEVQPTPLTALFAPVIVQAPSPIPDVPAPTQADSAQDELPTLSLPAADGIPW